MRILVMVHNLTGGGAERVAALWTCGFVERGHDVAVVVERNKKSEMTYPIPENTKIYELNRWWQNGITYRLFRYRDWYHPRAVKKIVEDFRPDVIIGVLPPYAKWAYKATKDMGIPIINTEHNTFELPTGVSVPTNFFKEKFEENLLYDYVTLLTEADKRIFDNYKVSVLPNPLAFKPLKIIPEKQNVILAAGRLEAWECKGFDLLIKAWGMIAKEHKDWKLKIAGGGKRRDFDTLNRFIMNANVSKQTSLIGFCDDMQSIYKESSIFVLSSRYEGFGMVLVEAMSQGCACIACDFRGRQKEIITNENEGLICPTDDVNSLAVAMDRLINDKAYRMNVQQNAIIRSDYYSLSNTMDRWEKIFKKIKLS